MRLRGLMPSSLRGQMLVLLLGALITVQLITMALFFSERRLAVRAALGAEAAERTANVVGLVEAAPADLHPEILRSAGSPLMRFELSDAPRANNDGLAAAGAIAGRVRRALGDDSERDIRTSVEPLSAAAFSAPLPQHNDLWMRRMHTRMHGNDAEPMGLILSISLRDGGWLNAQTMFHRPPLQWAWPGVVSTVLMALAIILVVWFMVRRITGPMNALVDGADKFGRSGDTEPIPLAGPKEIRRLTDSFNRMQDRLTRYVRERVQMLAALSHDLRSPLTAMRLRLEMIEDTETRDRLEATVDEMQQMVEATLAFAKGIAVNEPEEPMDLRSLLQDLVEDIARTGADVRLGQGGPIKVTSRPTALRRAIRNVIENSVKYGGMAHITAATVDGLARIVIEDAGPGIPEEDLEKVFEPFVRLEGSRSLETGGVGLGLATAQSIVHALGGEISLSNRDAGGLRVTIDLPVAKS